MIYRVKLKISYMDKYFDFPSANDALIFMDYIITYQISVDEDDKPAKVTLELIKE